MRELDPVIYHRPRARAAADRRDRRRRSRSAPASAYADAHGGAGRALSRPGRDVAAPRLGADPQRRHARRQHRQRLADRRQLAGADRGRRAARCCAAATSGASCRSRTSSSPTASRTGRPGEFVEAIIVPKPAPGTRFRAYKISKRFDQDISAVWRRSSCSSTASAGRRRADRLRRHGGDAQAGARTPRRRCVGQAWNEASVEAAMAALARGLHADQRHARLGRLPRSRSRATCCGACMSRPRRGAETRLVGDRSLAHV